ncbi:fungal-specific transcription factor domain-containing protein [Talaromyces proteolyticus]|uniref:Fungal-specific transcription factor domain-containing protein n=1 Tax=Talaromyces proteolyticus TaxID=1131652 RepID=A0AAD4Q128_9EURO|nr:fungal-specific transcription factor domain-containing protein [Talaromyces proteolyticus]KAH8697891.1 fungal-specific transcription factor domain-containing protein [Talaromyces proteolyticus]
MHIPTVRSLMKAAYLRICQGESVPPGQAALLLSVFALGAFFCQNLDNHKIVTSDRDASQLSSFLCKEALDVLDYSHQNASGTIEDVQALILMCYVTYHLDGFSARYRLLLAQASSIARDLRLHRLDANDHLSENAEVRTRELVEREVKRRVFWHIAATDWLQSVISGPQEGTYFIHPQHVNVRLPRDCNDDEICLGENNDLVVEPQPTGMTFFLERVRLSHICREATDILPLETSKLVQIPYEQIILLDKKFQDFFSSLPFFFRIDSESRQKSKLLEIVYTNIGIMRYCITTAAHSRRCRLHQRFLLRQFFNNSYAYSRKACLESARAIIQIHEDPLRKEDSTPRTKAQTGMAVHFIHLALVVMVMDLCINKDIPGEEGRKEEVKATLEILERARDISPILGRSLDSLYEVLRKYNVSLSVTLSADAKEVPELTPDTEIGSLDPLYHVYMQSTQLELHGLGPGTNFDGVSQNSPQFEANLDLITWDNLFSAVDSRPF